MLVLSDPVFSREQCSPGSAYKGSANREENKLSSSYQNTLKAHLNISLRVSLHSISTLTL